jgi:hypothetical protein
MNNEIRTLCLDVVNRIPFYHGHHKKCLEFSPAVMAVSVLQMLLQSEFC